MFNLERIDHVAFTVSDIERSINWYKETLGLEHYYKDEWDGEPAMMGKGGTCIAFFKARGENPEPQPPGWNTIAMKHLAFRADMKNFKEAQISLTEKGIKYRFADHGICHSIYFKDPDGHEIEITTYNV